MSDSPSARRVMSSITTLLLDADGVIQKPGPGWRVALASNQQPHRAAHRSWALGYASRFDAQCYSCSLGAAKPQKRFFTKALATLDCPPEAAPFIDDSPANVHSARAAGLYAEVFSLDQGHAALQDILRSYGIQAR